MATSAMLAPALIENSRDRSNPTIPAMTARLGAMTSMAPRRDVRARAAAAGAAISAMAKIAPTAGIVTTTVIVVKTMSKASIAAGSYPSPR